MVVFERSDYVKERDQAKDDLKVEGVDIEICMNNGPRNSMLALDDVLDKQGLNTLHVGPICLYQARSLDLGDIELWV